MHVNKQPPYDVDSAHLVERLALSIAALIEPALPLSIQLWNAKTIAAYLQRSPAVVLERVVTLPDFPTPIRLPSMSAKSTNDVSPNVDRSSGQPLWKATEVIMWVNLHREKRVGRPRSKK